MVNFERLKFLRKQKMITQVKMANILGCTEQHYQRIEYGKVDIPSSDLVVIADYFGVSLDYLIGRHPEEELLQPLRKYFSHKLSFIRQQAGVTLQQLAEAIGLTEEEVRLLESGENSPSFEIVRDVAEFFNKSFDFFIGSQESYVEQQPATEHFAGYLEREKEIEDEYLKMISSSNYSGNSIEVYKAVRNLAEYDRRRRGKELLIEAAAILGDSINLLLTEDTDRDKRRRFERIVAIVKKETAARNR